MTSRQTKRGGVCLLVIRSAGGVWPLVGLVMVENNNKKAVR